MKSIPDNSTTEKGLELEKEININLEVEELLKFYKNEDSQGFSCENNSNNYTFLSDISSCQVESLKSLISKLLKINNQSNKEQNHELSKEKEREKCDNITVFTYHLNIICSVLRFHIVLREKQKENIENLEINEINKLQEKILDFLEKLPTTVVQKQNASEEVKKIVNENNLNTNDSKNLKIEYLEGIDKLLIIKNDKLKLLTRDEKGNFNFEFLYEYSSLETSEAQTKDTSEENDSLKILLNRKRLVSLLKAFNLKAFLSKSRDSNNLVENH